VKIDSNQLSGYALGGDPHQLGVIASAPVEDQEAAVTQVCRHLRGKEAWEVLEALGLTEVATRMLGEGGAAA
jgi:hypothetical protein